jgi:hypothetical protein
MSASVPIAGCRRRDIRIQKAASPSSIVIPTMIATTPQAVGRTKTARKMARMSARVRV